eukprot:scaffold51557_cov48-Phaeocystis_antarctica.AAC.1
MSCSRCSPIKSTVASARSNLKSEKSPFGARGGDEEPSPSPCRTSRLPWALAGRVAGPPSWRGGGPPAPTTGAPSNYSSYIIPTPGSIGPNARD